MALSRRTFVHQIVGAGVSAVATPVLRGKSIPVIDHSDSAAPARVSAVLFDAFPVFDPRPIGTIAEEEFPGHGAELMTLWRTRQFEYSWLRVVTNDYADFWQCTIDALRFSANSLALPLTTAQQDRLMNAWLTLRPWPDAPAALRALRAMGIRLGFLSNFTPAMLDASIRGSELTDVFDHVLSTDRVRGYKPDPRAYRLGVEAMRLPREEIVFAAFAGWDAAGARRFGYPTFWVNRLQAPPEELGVSADATGRTLADLVTFVASRREHT